MRCGAVLLVLCSLGASDAGAAVTAAQKAGGHPHPVAAAAAAVWRHHKKDELVARKVKPVIKRTLIKPVIRTLNILYDR